MCCGWGLVQTLAAKRAPLGILKVMELIVTALAGAILSGKVVTRVFCVGAEQAVSSQMHALARKRKKRMRFVVMAVVSVALNCP